jgi:sigma-E factor negative regulatory protein RseA
MKQSAEQKLAPESGPRGVVSALADGALGNTEAQRAIDLVLASNELRDVWGELHWVGDCLRSEETGSLVGSEDFMARFSKRLALEPTVLAPQVSSDRAPRRWLRYGLPSAAVVVVSAAVWMALPGQGGLVAQDQAAMQQSVLPVVAEAKPAPAVHAVDPAQLNEYLAAHQEFGATALHGPGAIQAASFNIVADNTREHP